jgi:hypothetical protein
METLAEEWRRVDFWLHGFGLTHMAARNLEKKAKIVEIRQER